MLGASAHGDYDIETELFKPEPYHCPRGFGREPFGPVIGMQAIKKLELRRIVKRADIRKTRSNRVPREDVTPQSPHPVVANRSALSLISSAACSREMI